MPILPTLPLLKLGNGKKLHIPHRDRPLCEVGRKNLMSNFYAEYVQADGVTCHNCKQIAEKIAAYL